MKKINSILQLIIMQMAICVALFACTNSLMNSNRGTSLLSGVNASPSVSAALQDKYVITNVTIAGLSSNTINASPTPISTSTAAPATNIYFDTSKSTAPLLNHCNVATANGVQTSKPCECKYSWTQTNTISGNTVSIARNVQTAVTAVQPYVLSCSAPEVYFTEIPNGTQISITLLPGPSNADSALFTVNKFTYLKNTTTAAGSFQDAQGHSFDNIHHYGCYQKFKRGMTVQSKLFQKTNQFTQQVMKATIASQFCIAKSTDAAGAQQSETCPNLPDADYSSQAYYFNFYIRKSELGDINQYNDGYVCPIVRETLIHDGTIGTQNSVWPLDTSFALSLGYTTDFTIGVEAHTKLANGQDPTASTNTCFASNNNDAGNGGANTTGTITSCLGFAAPVNTDGTCPKVQDSSGRYRSTYRLRRYVALYPRLYETDGTPLANRSQDIDTIYVLDRPVKSPSSSSNDPISKPYTMLGPKPCPFSFYDKKNVTNISPNSTAPNSKQDPLDATAATVIFSPGYVSTSNAAWNGKNIDGIELPNFDQSEISCSAALPILSADKSTFFITTVNKYATATNAKNHVYIRPSQSFFPHYEEDTKFKGCAPQSDPVVDPPLHFSRDPVSGNVAWCSESYPTQNSSISSIDPAVFPSPKASVISTRASGVISPFTSHVAKNSVSTACTASVPTNSLTATSTYVYPASADASANYAYARHMAATQWKDLYTNETFNTSQTCDRTVTTAGLAWPTYPLLAREGDIESSISTDSSYFCTVTYDNNGAKTGKSTPTDGCCDSTSVFVPTATSTSGNLGVVSASGVAHLEPGASSTACKSPAY